MVVHIPIELIVKILSWLPSKSLLRCRSVCKSWLSVISCTQFRLLYLHNLSPHLLLRVSSTENKKMYILPFNHQDTELSIEFPLNPDLNLMTIGCCNGVICLESYSEIDETILWNPSIRKKLTLIPPIYRDNDTQVLGFGYDKMTYDYKVVRLAYNTRAITIPQVEVYTVKTAIWRVVGFPENLSCFCIFSNCINPQMCFNGSAHWIACTNSLSPPSSILAFDMSTERFSEIQLPENLAQEFPMNLRLVVVQESLGVIYSNRLINNISSTYVIWAMKEYKNPDSWTMLSNMNFPDKDAVRAVGVTNHGDLITNSLEGGLKVYNQEGCYNVYGSSNEGNVSESISVEGYQESLGLLDVGDDIGNEGLVQELDDK